MYAQGFLKVAAASPVLRTGDSKFNVNEILKILSESKDKNIDIIAFPELAISGASIGDLIYQQYLYDDIMNALEYLLDSNTFPGVVIVGSFIINNNKIYNCSLVIQGHDILGIIPKYNLMQSNELNEIRWFSSGKDISFNIIELFGKNIPFGPMLFVNDDNNVAFGCEIGNDLGSIMPPHINLYTNGAVIVFNSSASREAVGRIHNRRALVKSVSYCHSGAYVYAASNASESTSEAIFSNHKMIVENGKFIEETYGVELKSNIIYGDIDISKLHYLRKKKGYGKDNLQNSVVLPKVLFHLPKEKDFIFSKPIDTLPFIPSNEEDYKQIIDMQATSVMKRLEYIGIKKAVIGISGGLDSTLALLSLCHMCDIYNMDRQNIIGVTMPTNNSSNKTYNNALSLMKKLKISMREINIEEDVQRQLMAIGHDGVSKDITYENIQARFRTYTLMNIANLVGGIVIGTSDLSEVALGWSTFNGDQMAMYGINAGLPKTVVKATTNYYKEIYPEVKDIIDDIVNTPISPELKGNNQLTEDIIGKYVINDFIIYHLFQSGDSEERLIFLLQKAFNLNIEEANKYLNNFFKRFCHQQYKRLTMPEGVKILDLSLSPRSETVISGDIYKSKK